MALTSWESVTTLDMRFMFRRFVGGFSVGPFILSKTTSKLKDFPTLALLVFGVLALACSVHMHTGTQTLPSGAGHGMGPSFTANSHVHGNQPSLDVSKLAADEMSVTNGDFDFNGVFDFGGTALDGVTFDFEDFGCGV